MHKVEAARKTEGPRDSQNRRALPRLAPNQGTREPRQTPDTKTIIPALHCLFPEGEGEGDSCILHIQTGSEETQTLGTDSPLRRY